MTKQPEALRLADELEWQTHWKDHAAELRRLHADVQRLGEAHLQQGLKIAELFAQRDALLEACRFYASMMGRRKSDNEPFYMTALDFDCGDRARAAIAAAEEGK